MSTPQTLTQTLPPHQHLDHRQRYLPSPQDRYLPPPRPSSNLSNGYQQPIPTRPSSNLSARQQYHPPPQPPPAARAESSMSNGLYSHTASHVVEYPYASTTIHQRSHEDLRRSDVAARTSQPHRALPPAASLQQATGSTSRALAPTAPHPMPSYPPATAAHNASSDDPHRQRREKDPVDWVAYFGGKPPAEIIEIHDDDSPAPPVTTRPLLPVHLDDTGASRHVDKKRRVQNEPGDKQTYSTNNTPYSQSNGTSTDSFQTHTAPTSLGSVASSGSALLDTTQVGQKRKRTTRLSDLERKKQESQRPGPKGYLAEYGEYVPPPKQLRKQKEVPVPTIYDVGPMLLSFSLPRRYRLQCDYTY